MAKPDYTIRWCSHRNKYMLAVGYVTGLTLRHMCGCFPVSRLLTFSQKRLIDEQAGNTTFV